MGDERFHLWVTIVAGTKLQEVIFCGVDRRGAGLIGGIDRGEIAMGFVSGERGLAVDLQRGLCLTMREKEMKKKSTHCLRLTTHSQKLGKKLI